MTCRDRSERDDLAHRKQLAPRTARALDFAVGAMEVYPGNAHVEELVIQLGAALDRGAEITAGELDAVVGMTW